MDGFACTNVREKNGSSEIECNVLLSSLVSTHPVVLTVNIKKNILW